MNIPANLKYTKDHEWIKIEGNVGTIGITEYAQGELGDIVYVDINPDLAEVTMGETFGTIEAVKTVSDLYAPVTGKVIELNKRLNDEPQQVNSDPYGEGWIIKVEIADASQLNELLDAAGYEAQIAQ
ncbi:MAG: glycine cleavage system protein H [Stygiobacter sp. RIFOXYC12_FULL_38_8]|nr:MAG: glycine cleavage system protein H [Stygiobacter sp. GWC2_38_9]OGU77293.1 MAG: glycine cleavage system protein H [Stygiobacter sp. RIFOXYA12_FULL_38_9]OGV09015.1 MAG: glycine cleavage system protein H [Stygiobacter sp. RIFOXYB2_FULL_37_11]OGV14168.1 MAG: glycine cleavage system protein H [Stygiobacter sp. RIFOXYA2_FULL_38_8]OGV16241.1 MAG: glycine cleavage system protein H [Stygiobacter sp. RIFOXYC2_FULL_38_25]OGV25657.1 MAG: glycine cleavage system protein H [Stygiobacter sp. RIFOXYC12